MPDDARFTFDLPPQRDERTGCLVYMGTLTSAGYPAQREHRVAAGAGHGEVVDHVYERGCRYRCCIEPSHLEIVTKEENSRRAIAARRAGHRTYDRRGLLWELGLLPPRWAHLGEILAAHNREPSVV